MFRFTLQGHIGRIEQVKGTNAIVRVSLALKGRARELERLGLAREVSRNVLAFEPTWRDRLQAMELHLDIRKRVVRERTLQKHDELDVDSEEVVHGS